MRRGWHSSRGGGERGETLVEILLTIAVVGIAVVGILGGIGTGISLSNRRVQQVRASAVLVSAADSVKVQAHNSYVPCPTVTTSSYQPTQGVSLPTGWTSANVVITAVKGWNGSAFVSCPATDSKLELVSIRATSPDGLVAESTDVVVRDPS